MGETAEANVKPERVTKIWNDIRSKEKTQEMATREKSKEGAEERSMHAKLR